MQLDDLFVPDAPDIAPVAHGNVGIIAAQHHLSAFGDDIAVAVDTGIDRSLGTAIADGFDLLPNSYNPNDNHLRLAPSLPPVEDLEKAMEVLTICLKLSALEKLLNK